MSAVITWHSSGDDDVCDNCDALDGQEFTIQTLPGWPGDSTFGDDVMCLGGPQCRCSLEYSDDSGNAASGENTLREPALSGLLSADLGPMGHVDQWAAGREAFRDTIPDVIQPNEVYSARARALMRDSVRQQLGRELGIHPADVPARTVADRVPAIYKSLDGDLKVVYQMLTKHYPDDSIEWVGKMSWNFRDVPIEKISVTGPASDKDAKTIRKMSKKMKKGKPVKPLVLIDPGDKGLLQVADGHHRATAALHANKRKVPAYVGTPQDSDDTWRKDVMEMQIVRAKKMFAAKDFSASMGFAPFDLSGPEIDIKFAGLLLMASDSGRVLMLQRSLSENDEAAGTWEFPGGNLEDGEEALDGAIREWQEEVGSQLPAVNVVGWWASPNGYMGFLAICASEKDVDIHSRDVVNPDDPDGDNAEAVAWFWPADLVSMPGVRRETRDMTPWARIITRTVKP